MSFQTQILRYTDQELASLIEDETATEALGKEADKVRRANYGNEVYVRGLIEFSNYCKNDCYYCGIRKGNRKADRLSLIHISFASASSLTVTSLNPFAIKSGIIRIAAFTDHS